MQVMTYIINNRVNLFVFAKEGTPFTTAHMGYQAK